MSFFWRFVSNVVLLAMLSGCGLYTPVKDLRFSDERLPDGTTPQGNYENDLVIHVSCEIAKGIRDSHNSFHLHWLDSWGTTVTQSITAEDQGGVAPGISAINPLQNVVFPFASGGNVTSPQSFSFSAGVTASANALRTETIQYTFRNRDLVKYAERNCDSWQKGVLIDSDLKINKFIYDKAVIASSHNETLYPEAGGVRPPFNTFTEEVTFVAAFGGSATPTWKLARISANTSSNLFVAQRTVTNDLVVTLGPVKEPVAATDPLLLSDDAMKQHNARVQAAAIAVSVIGQSH